MNPPDLSPEKHPRVPLGRTFQLRKAGSFVAPLVPAAPQPSESSAANPVAPSRHSEAKNPNPAGSAVEQVGDAPPGTPSEKHLSKKLAVQWPEVGQELFGFRLTGELGRGGFSRVYLAEQADLAGRAVVLKVSAPEGAEPQTLAQLQHTHIVPIHSVHEDVTAGVRAVCMPYFGGATLSDILTHLWTGAVSPIRGKQLAHALDVAQDGRPAAPGSTNPEGPQTPVAILSALRYDRASVWIAARLAEALEHAHQRGVLHRDIKPSNILLAADGQPLLLDFNVSHSDRQPIPEVNVGGTPAYTAPEHMRALLDPTADLVARVDHRSDIYSLGLILYEMLTGQRPFAADGSYSVPTSILRAMAEERSRVVPALRSHRPELSRGLESILRKCLESDPDRRYQRAEHLAEDLRRFLDDRPLQHAPERSWRERAAKWLRRHPRLSSSGSVALVALLLLAGAVTGFVGVRNHLATAREQILVTQAQERRRSFEEAALRALCLVNTVSDLDDNAVRGRNACEKALALYDVVERADWQQHPDWQRLSASEQRQLGENVRELLLLLAWARVQTGLSEATVLRDALTLVDRAAAVDGLPPSPALWRAQADYLTALGKLTAAREARARAALIPAATAQDHYLLATTHARQGGEAALRQAVAELDQALLLNPRHYWALTQRGICLLERGEATLAVADFSAAVGLRPDMAWGYFNRGVALSRCSEKERAERDFTAAIEQDPELVAAHVNRGLLRLELRRPAEALRDFDAALQRGSDGATLHAGRGAALEALGRHTDADAAFAATFARLSGLSGEAQVRVRWAFGFAVCKRLPDTAQAAFDAVLRTHPHQPQALYGRAVLAVEAGREAEGLDFLTRAVDADPGFVDARRSRAVLLARRGTFDQAEQEINRCLERDGRCGITLYAAACVAARAAARASDDAVTGQALALLEKAFTRGYGRDKAPTDPDLTALQAHPRFKALLASSNAS